MKQDCISKTLGKDIVSVGGLSEKGVSKPFNQDAFRVGVSEKYGLAYIITADGLGSCKHSDQGAYTIVTIIERWISTNIPEYSALNDFVVKGLIRGLLLEWKSSYEAEEIFDYDTTVHVAVYYRGRILIGGIGDGMVLIKMNDQICKDTVNKDSMFSNVTESICSVNAHELLKFEIYTVEDIDSTAIVIISTDGISDDLIPEKKLTLPGYFEETLKREGITALQDELTDWIMNWETEGHSDDKTLCYMIVCREDI